VAPEPAKVARVGARRHLGPVHLELPQAGQDDQRVLPRVRDSLGHAAAGAQRGRGGRGRRERGRAAAEPAAEAGCQVSDAVWDALRGIDVLRVSWLIAEKKSADLKRR